MKVAYNTENLAQVYLIEATGNSLTEAVRSGLDQGCDAVDRIVEVERGGKKAPTTYHYVIDIALKCPGAERLHAEATAYWAQAEPNLQNFFPKNSAVFWSVVAKLPDPEPVIVQ